MTEKAEITIHIKSILLQREAFIQGHEELSRYKEQNYQVSGACRGLVFGGLITPDLTTLPKILTAPYHHIPIYIYIS